MQALDSSIESTYEGLKCAKSYTYHFIHINKIPKIYQE